jgi:4-hydroxybenzoate polyprenyltransferase
MKKKPLSRNAYFSAAVIVFIYRRLNFPVTGLQIISSIMLAVTFSRQLKINTLIRLAFGINAVYMIIHLGCLFISLYEPINYSSTLHLPIALFIYGLILVWFIRMPYQPNEAAILP